MSHGEEKSTRCDASGALLIHLKGILQEFPAGYPQAAEYNRMVVSMGFLSITVKFLGISNVPWSGQRLGNSPTNGLLG